MTHNAQSAMLTCTQGIRKQAGKPEARRSGKHGPFGPFRAFYGRLRSHHLKVKWVVFRDRYGGRRQITDQGCGTAQMTSGAIMVHAGRWFSVITSRWVVS
jgi:hypothetical protein